jgi:hypothetical protein
MQADMWNCDAEQFFVIFEKNMVVNEGNKTPERVSLSGKKVLHFVDYRWDTPVGSSDRLQSSANDISRGFGHLGLLARGFPDCYWRRSVDHCRQV